MPIPLMTSGRLGYEQDQAEAGEQETRDVADEVRVETHREADGCDAEAEKSADQVLLGCGTRHNPIILSSNKT